MVFMVMLSPNRYIFKLYLAGHIAAHFGWRAAFLVPGILAVITALWLFDRLRDRPQSLGLPDVEVYRNEPVKEKSADEKKEEDEMSYVQIFKKICFV